MTNFGIDLTAIRYSFNEDLVKVDSQALGLLLGIQQSMRQRVKIGWLRVRMMVKPVGSGVRLTTFKPSPSTF